MIRATAAWVVVFVGSHSAAAAAHVVMSGTQPGEHGSAFPPSSTCDACHRGYDPSPDVPAGDGYWGSAMAWAAKDPVFRAALEASEAVSPGYGDFCLRCHAPSAFLEGRAVISDGSALFPSDRGVECAFCHRLVDGSPIGPFIANGRFFVEDEPIYRAAFDDALDVGHAVGASDYVGSVRACSLCHEQSNPFHGLRDPDGDVLYPQFPNDRTYSEWEASAYADEGTTCVDCHMPVVPGRACSDPSAPERDAIHGHGWNAADTLTGVLMAEMDPEMNEAHVAALEAGAERARASLRSAATIEVRTSELCADVRNEMYIRVTNLTGHRLPTGFIEGRRMWLSVEVTDVLGTELLVSGEYHEDTGVLFLDRQARVYQARHGRFGRGDSREIPLQDLVLEESRIPPRGFDPEPDRLDLFTWGYVFGRDGAEEHQDDVRYRFEVPGVAAGPVRVVARLLYQRLSREYAEYLRVTAPIAGDALFDAWEATGRAPPETMAELDVVLPIFACSGDAGPAEDAGEAGPDGGGDGWGGIAPAERGDGGPRYGRKRVPDPERRQYGTPAGGGCACDASTDGSRASAFSFVLAATLLLALGRRASDRVEGRRRARLAAPYCARKAVSSRTCALPLRRSS